MVLVFVSVLLLVLLLLFYRIARVYKMSLMAAEARLMDALSPRNTGMHRQASVPVRKRSSARGLSRNTHSESSIYVSRIRKRGLPAAVRSSSGRNNSTDYVVKGIGRGRGIGSGRGHVAVGIDEHSDGERERHSISMWKTIGDDSLIHVDRDGVVEKFDLKDSGNGRKKTATKSILQNLQKTNGNDYNKLQSSGSSMMSANDLNLP